MLIAVLVLALFGLWSGPVVALLLLDRHESSRLKETAAVGVLRLECQVCGAHTLLQQLQGVNPSAE